MRELRDHVDSMFLFHMPWENISIFNTEFHSQNISMLYSMISSINEKPFDEQSMPFKECNKENVKLLEHCSMLCAIFSKVISCYLESSLIIFTTTEEKKINKYPETYQIKT